jgi:hypothetical protein
MGRKDGAEWTAAAASQPTIPKTDRLQGAEQLSTPFLQPVAQH